MILNFFENNFLLFCVFIITKRNKITLYRLSYKDYILYEYHKRLSPSIRTIYAKLPNNRTKNMRFGD